MGEEGREWHEIEGEMSKRQEGMRSRILDIISGIE